MNIYLKRNMNVLILLGTDNDIEKFLEQSQIFKCHFLQTITYKSYILFSLH